MEQQASVGIYCTSTAGSPYWICTIIERGFKYLTYNSTTRQYSYMQVFYFSPSEPPAWLALQWTT